MSKFSPEFLIYINKYFKSRKDQRIEKKNQDLKHRMAAIQCESTQNFMEDGLGNLRPVNSKKDTIKTTKEFLYALNNNNDKGKVKELINVRSQQNLTTNKNNSINHKTTLPPLRIAHIKNHLQNTSNNQYTNTSNTYIKGIGKVNKDYLSFLPPINSNRTNHNNINIDLNSNDLSIVDTPIETDLDINILAVESFIDNSPEVKKSIDFGATTPKSKVKKIKCVVVNKNINFKEYVKTEDDIMNESSRKEYKKQISNFCSNKKLTETFNKMVTLYYVYY